MSVVTGVSPAAAPGGAVRAVELAIGGMTCASCAARVEKKLGKLNGVSATVNFATGTARVSLPAVMPATELISVVEQAGYTAALPAPPRRAGRRRGRGGRHRRDRHVAAAAAGVIGAGHPGGGAGDDPGVAVPELAVGVPGAGFPGGRVGSVAVPPGRGREPAAQCRDDGHAGVGRGHRGVPAVAVRAVCRRRGPGRRADERRLAGARQRDGGHLPGRRRRGDDADPARPLSGGPGEAARGRGAAGAAVAGRQGRRRAAGRQ